jgi:hypothetical protein
MSLEKQVTGTLKIDEKTTILNPLLKSSQIIINTINKTVIFEYTATIQGVSAGRITPPLDYSSVTTAAVPTLTHLNIIITTFINDNLLK